MFLTAVNKMLEIAEVGKDWFEVSQTPEWFVLYSWDQSQEDQFQDWFINFLTSETKLSKEYALKEFQWFILGYGLTLVG